MNLQQHINEYLASIGPEREHDLREILQDQLGRHWLSIYCPEKPEPILAKIRGGKESRVA
jgi:hypothetical protein